ncbi:RDD family protein [Moheibacter stercoris]|uniref:RDD family membrane protein YckC n=1 Tax=Moheibacter stercoris TaxID=1628251 RepID=A0ABV2LTR9_9FLAO
MQFVSIKTPLNVNVNIPHAGIGWRILAFLLDLFFIYVYIIAMTYFFVNILGMTSSILHTDDQTRYDINVFIEFLYIILLFPALFYSLWTEMLFRGQTFGKMICRIRVVKLDGYKAGFPEYFTRWIFRFIDFWTGSFLILFLIPIFGQEIGAGISAMFLTVSGIVAVFFISKTKNSQRLGDIVAGTTVLKLKEKHSINITILEDLKEDYVPTYPQVIRLSDNDARIIKDTFVAATKRKDFVTVKKLRRKLEEVMEIESNLSDYEFINIVMKDFNYYTQNQ